MNQLLDKFSIEHVRRENNARADVLSKLASTKRSGQWKTIIQETLFSPSIDSEETSTVKDMNEGWMESIRKFREEDILPEDPKAPQKIKSYTEKAFRPHYLNVLIVNKPSKLWPEHTKESAYCTTSVVLW